MNEAALSDLVEKRCAAIWQKGFLAPEECPDLAAKVTGYEGLTHYSNAPDLHLRRTGLTFFETQFREGLREVYFQTSHSEHSEFEAYLRPNENPNSLVQESLNANWPQGALVEEVFGNACHYGTCRVFSRGQRLPPHVDYLPHDIENYPLELWPKTQLAVNVYIKNPKEGGEINWWNRSPRKDELKRIQSGVYDFIKDSELSRPDISIKPEDGDLVIIRASDIHSVSPFEGGDRISFSFFVNYYGNDKPLRYYV